MLNCGAPVNIFSSSTHDSIILDRKTWRAAPGPRHVLEYPPRLEKRTLSEEEFSQPSSEDTKKKEHDQNKLLVTIHDMSLPFLQTCIQSLVAVPSS